MAKTPRCEIQLFEPAPDAVYTIEAAAQLADLPRRTILVYCKHRLLSPAIGETDRGYYFDRDGIRALRRIEALRTVCGNDLAGIKIILDLTNEVERLHSEMRSLVGNDSQRNAQNRATRLRDNKSALCTPDSSLRKTKSKQRRM